MLYMLSGRMYSIALTILLLGNKWQKCLKLGKEKLKFSTRTLYKQIIIK